MNIRPGRFYLVDADGAMIEESRSDFTGVDAWICRRVADFPGHQAPAGCAIAPCASCGHPIAFNADRPIGVAPTCMQCNDIEPLPIDGT